MIGNNPGSLNPFVATGEYSTSGSPVVGCSAATSNWGPLSAVVSPANAYQQREKILQHRWLGRQQCGGVNVGENHAAESFRFRLRRAGRIHSSFLIDGFLQEKLPDCQSAGACTANAVSFSPVTQYVNSRP